MAEAGARRRIEALLSLGRNEEAEALIRQGLATEPQSFVLLSQLTRSLIGGGKGKAALVAARELVVMRPDSADAHRLLAVCYSKLHRGRLAEACARQALALDPEDGWHHYTLAVAALQRLRLRQARASARRAVELDPEEADFHLLVGKLHSFGRRGKTVAREAYAQALRLEPENAQALRGLTETSASPARFGKTVGGLRQSLDLDPTDPKPVYDALAVELRRMLFWLRVLVVVVFVVLILSSTAHGMAPSFGRLAVFALLAAGFGFLGRTHAQLAAGERRLVARTLRRKPGLAIIAASVLAFFVTSALWALTGADWTMKPVIWSWVAVLAGIVFRYYWNLLRLPFLLLWFLVLKIRAWLPTRRGPGAQPGV